MIGAGASASLVAALAAVSRDLLDEAGGDIERSRQLMVRRQLLLEKLTRLDPEELRSHQVGLRQLEREGREVLRRWQGARGRLQEALLVQAQAGRQVARFGQQGDRVTRLEWTG